MYWIDNANTKKAIAYYPDHVDKMFNGGFVSIFEDNKHKSDMGVRLYCENKKISG